MATSPPAASPVGAVDEEAASGKRDEPVGGAEEVVLFRGPATQSPDVTIAVTEQVVGRVASPAGPYCQCRRRLRFFQAGPTGHSGTGAGPGAPAAAHGGAGDHLVSDVAQSEVAVLTPAAVVADTGLDPDLPAALERLAAGAPDTSTLCLPYHRAFCAAVAGWAPGGVAAVRGLSGRAAVIGLGGGGFATVLAASTAMSVTAVELEPGVCSLARAFFGFRPDANPARPITTHVGDGAAYMLVRSALPDAVLRVAHGVRVLATWQSLAATDASSLAVCVVDTADSVATDADSVLAPCGACRSTAFVQAAWDALQPGGLAVFNVLQPGAPDSDGVAAVVGTCARVFDGATVLRTRDNRVVLGVKGGADRGEPGCGVEAALQLPPHVAACNGLLRAAASACVSAVKVVCGATAS